MNRFITGLATSAAILALSTTVMAQGQGGTSGNAGAGSGQATWPSNNSPDPNQQPQTGANSPEVTGAMPQGGQIDDDDRDDATPGNSNSGPGSAMNPAPVPGSSPAQDAATGPKQ